MPKDSGAPAATTAVQIYVNLPVKDLKRSRYPGWEEDDMRRLTAMLSITLLIALGTAACGTSEETRCKRAGGVWRGTSCETQGR